MKILPTVLTTIGDPPVEIIVNQRDYDPTRHGPRRKLNPGRPDEQILFLPSPADREVEAPPDLAAEEPESTEKGQPSVPIVPPGVPFYTSPVTTVPRSRGTGRRTGKGR